MSNYRLPNYQGTDVDYWERKRAHSHLAAIEKLKEEELEHLRKGSEVILEELDIPQEGRLDKDVNTDTPPLLSGGLLLPL